MQFKEFLKWSYAKLYLEIKIESGNLRHCAEIIEKMIYVDFNFIVLRVECSLVLTDCIVSNLSSLVFLRFLYLKFLCFLLRQFKIALNSVIFI